MNFSVVDAGGLALAVLSYGLVLLLPGAALAGLSGAFGFRAADPTRKPAIGLVVGLAVLPVIDSVVTRAFDLGSALFLNLALAGVAVVLAVRGAWHLRLTPGCLALFGLWFAVMLVEWIDFDIDGKLYESFTIIDMVKHAATTQAIHDTGAPPRDPFFLRPERVSYYYFFYTLAALSQRLCGGLIDAKAAVGGLAFWTGLGLAGMVRLLLQRGGFLSCAAERHGRTLILAILAASGTDIVFVIWRGRRDGTWLPDPAAWNEQVTGWFESVLWVPHHVTALIALFAGLMAAVDGLTIAERSEAPPEGHVRRRAGSILIAGACFASMLGLSVWVTLGGVTTACLWFAVLAVERRWRAVLTLILVAAVALCLAAPQIVDLRAGRSSGIPIGMTVRAFMPVDDYMPAGPWRFVARLICLPLNYAAEFGVLFLGTLLYWRDRRHRLAPDNELARVLTIAAVAGLCLGTFLQSLLLNNDLGWRVMLLPSLAGVVWTLAIIDRRWIQPSGAAARADDGLLSKIADGLHRDRGRAACVSLLVFLALGYATTAYAFVGLRAFYLLPLSKTAPLSVTGREIDRALRTAYAWANATLPREAVLQHNPGALDRVQRATAFGLYSRNRVAIGDHFGFLFGADFDQTAARLDALGPIFTQAIPDAEVRARAGALHIDALVVTADDPVWASRDAWPWRTRPLYTSAQVRIVAVASIGGENTAQQPTGPKPTGLETVGLERIGALP